MAAPEGTTMDIAIVATTGVVGGAYATYKELYTTKDYPTEGIRHKGGYPRRHLWIEGREPQDPYSTVRIS